MSSASSPHKRLIERLELLRSLADSLQQTQAALAGTSGEKLDHHTAQQQELCRQLRALAGFPELSSSTSAGLANDLQVAVRRVGDLNRLYAALLRRRRRTVDIFYRVLASSGTTYPAPKLLSRPDSEKITVKE
jgi:hypothetical protein